MLNAHSLFALSSDDPQLKSQIQREVMMNISVKLNKIALWLLHANIFFLIYWLDIVIGLFPLINWQ